MIAQGYCGIGRNCRCVSEVRMCPNWRDEPPADVHENVIQGSQRGILPQGEKHERTIRDRD